MLTSSASAPETERDIAVTCYLLNANVSVLEVFIMSQPYVVCLRKKCHAYTTGDYFIKYFYMLYYSYSIIYGNVKIFSIRLKEAQPCSQNCQWRRGAVCPVGGPLVTTLLRQIAEDRGPSSARANIS